MERQSEKTLGHDCIYDICKLKKPCQTVAPGTPRAAGGRNHGISGESWFYWVGTERARLRLEVFTDLYPDTVPSDHSQRCGLSPDEGRPLADRRKGAFLVLHKSADNGEGEKCDLLPGTRCVPIDQGALHVGAFFREHGDPAQFEQPESFWRAMEREFDRALTGHGTEDVQ